MLTEGRSADSASTGFRAEASWPPPGTATRALYLSADRALQPGAPAAATASFTDLATSMEERSIRAPQAESDWLFFQSAPLRRPPASPAPPASRSRSSSTATTAT